MFLTPAYAQAAGGAPGGSAFLVQMAPLVLIFIVMYFLLIRPQQRKLKDHRAMVSAVRRGDQVITQGGIIGKVAKVKEDGSGEIEVEIAEGVRVRVLKHTLTSVMSKTEPASANTN